MTVLAERYWREISSDLAQHAVAVRHFVLHADQDTLRGRIAGDTVLPAQASRRENQCGNARGGRWRGSSSRKPAMAELIWRIRTVSDNRWR